MCSNSAGTAFFLAMRTRTPMRPIGVFTWAMSSETVRAALWPARGSIPCVCFSNAERSPRSLPETVICTPMAPPSIIWRNVHMVALRNDMPLDMCVAILLHMTLGESSGFSSSETVICGSFSPNFSASTSVISLIPTPLRPMTMPGRVTCSVTRVPVGRLAISKPPNPASLMCSRRYSLISITL